MPHRRKMIPARKTQRSSPFRKESQKLKTEGSYGGLLVMGGLGLGFLSYILNVGGVQTTLDDVFRTLDRNMRSHDAAVQSGVMTVLPALGFVVMVAVLVGLVKMVAGGGGRKRPRVAEVKDTLSLHEFAELAREEGVGARVARESYRLLLPHYGERMRTALMAHLSVDLQLTPQMQKNMFADMLRMSDKSEPMRVLAYSTIMEMMQAVERCLDVPKSRAEDRAIRAANGELAQVR